ncbi:MAG: hypothetical protein WDZ36_05735, partial [Balneolaceae bacterium]
EENIDVVERTLDEIGIRDKKKVLVFNKIDKIEPAELSELKKMYPDALYVSAERGIGIRKVKDRLEILIEEDYVDFRYKIPFNQYKAVSHLHDVAVIEQEQYDPDDVTISGRMSREDQRKFEALLSELNGTLED